MLNPFLKTYVNEDFQNPNIYFLKIALYNKKKFTTHCGSAERLSSKKLDMRELIPSDGVMVLRPSRAANNAKQFDFFKLTFWN